MEAVEIKVVRRSTVGKGQARRLRRQGIVPAVFYGPNRSTVTVGVQALEIERKIAHLEGSHLLRLVHREPVDPEVDGKMVLLRELQRHPVTGLALHADFYEVDLTARLRVAIPLHFVGKAAGVVAGGILQPILREMEVECLPTEIPEFVEVDVSGLGIHDTVHVVDVQLPQGVAPVDEPTRTIVTVLPPTVEEEKPAAEAAEAVPAEGAPAEGVPGEPEPAVAKKGGDEE